MEMVLKTHYRLKSIPIIQSFVVESARYFGANRKESQDLRLATEEAAAHIINNYPQSESDYFEIYCSLDGDVFRVVLSNTGPPIDKERIPEYRVDAPEESADGLQFYLIKKFTDNFIFLNRGRKGWQTVLEKRLVSSVDPLKQVKEPVAVDKKVQVSEEVNIEIATPDDAYSITKLAYATYRYSYAKTVFYYPEMLKEYLQNQNIISFVAKNKNGEVVIHSAYMRSPYSRRIAETGALMSAPEYRGNRVVLKIAKKQAEFVMDESNGIDIVEANLVTAHTGSQKVAMLHRLSPFALKLSVHDRSRFIGMRGIGQQRESLLYALRFIRVLEPIELFISDKHRGFVEWLFSNTDQPVSIKKAPHAYSEETNYRVRKVIEDRFAEIEARSFDENWYRELKKLMFDIEADGVVSAHLKIPAFGALPMDIDKKLESLGYFFSGIEPKTLKEWYIVYTHLEPQRFEFSNIKLADERAFVLRDYVENSYKATLDF